jgi:hypothetical protein
LNIFNLYDFKNENNSIKVGNEMKKIKALLKKNEGKVFYFYFNEASCCHI